MNIDECCNDEKFGSGCVFNVDKAKLRTLNEDDYIVSCTILYFKTEQNNYTSLKNNFKYNQWYHPQSTSLL